MLFPTHYLGNFVLGLPWVLEVLRTRPNALLVLDSRFAGLAELVLDDSVQVLYYPRDKLAKNQPFFSRLRHYLSFLRALRARPGASLLDLEGERFTGVLSWLSGCRERIGPTGKHADRFYTRALDLDYGRHRFNAFGEVCADFTGARVPGSRLDYRFDQSLLDTLQHKLAGLDTSKRWVAIHPGASVSYKLWSRDYFVELLQALEAASWQVIWVGAGAGDAEIIEDIRERMPASTALNTCNALSVSELAALFSRCSAFVGSDSGPMHLAASTGVPVFALFGPSKENIWAPLGANSRVLRGSKACGEDCDAFHCRFDYQCLDSLLPDQVMLALQQLASNDMNEKHPQAGPGSITP